MSSLNPDPALIRQLAQLMDETGLTEIEYERGRERIRLSRQMLAVAAAQSAMGSAPAGSAAADPHLLAAPAGSRPNAVKSPMVGTVYLSPEPGSAPYVRPGDTVTEGQTLLLIEAMKTYNPVRAPRAGRVVQVLVADASPVEYDEDLVVIE